MGAKSSDLRITDWEFSGIPRTENGYCTQMMLHIMIYSSHISSRLIVSFARNGSLSACLAQLSFLLHPWVMRHLAHELSKIVSISVP